MPIQTSARQLQESNQFKMMYPKSSQRSTITDGSGSYKDKNRPKVVDELEKEDSLLRRSMRAYGIFEPKDMDYNDSFFRFPRIDPFNYIDGVREYLFFTKPDLCLMDGDYNLNKQAASISYFSDLFESAGYRKSVFGNLCSTYGMGKNCPFMRILSNRKTSNMDIPDIQVEEMETAVNMFGTKILYPKSSISSDEGVDFSIEFEDTRYLEIYHLFKVYDMYRQLKWAGILGPGMHLQSDYSRLFIKDQNTNFAQYATYLGYKILHDHFSVYKFLVDNDGETILFMLKATGVYPRSISRSAFSEIPDRGPLKITIGFKVSGWIEDNNPNIVIDFNHLCSMIGGFDCDSKDKSIIDQIDEKRVAPIYDTEIGMVSQESVKCPIIYSVDQQSSKYRANGKNNKSTLFKVYKLGWLLR